MRTNPLARYRCNYNQKLIRHDVNTAPKLSTHALACILDEMLPPLPDMAPDPNIDVFDNNEPIMLTDRIVVSGGAVLVGAPPPARDIMQELTFRLNSVTGTRLARKNAHIDKNDTCGRFMNDIAEAMPEDKDPADELTFRFTPKQFAVGANDVPYLWTEVQSIESNVLSIFAMLYYDKTFQLRAYVPFYGNTIDPITKRAFDTSANITRKITFLDTHTGLPKTSTVGKDYIRGFGVNRHDCDKDFSAAITAVDIKDVKLPATRHEYKPDIDERLRVLSLVETGLSAPSIAARKRRKSKQEVTPACSV